jgi:hypothetical protein
MNRLNKWLIVSTVANVYLSVFGLILETPDDEDARADPFVFERPCNAKAEALLHKLGACHDLFRRLLRRLDYLVL